MQRPKDCQFWKRYGKRGDIMFEAVSNMALNMQGGNVAPPQSAIPIQSEKTATTSENVFSIEQAKRVEQKAAQEEQQQAQKDTEVTEEVLKVLEQDIESMHSVGLTFSKHNETGRTVIKVMDKDNDKLIREIPAEDVLNLAAKMEEMIGILFDKEV